MDHLVSGTSPAGAARLSIGVSPERAIRPSTVESAWGPRATDGARLADELVEGAARPTDDDRHAEGPDVFAITTWATPAFGCQVFANLSEDDQAPDHAPESPLVARAALGQPASAMPLA